MSKKRVVISCGPIPARLDSVKYITNRFKGGLAIKTAGFLADAGYELTIVAWAFTANTELADLEQHPNVTEVVRVRDVFEYYDWFTAHAMDYDAFIMAAAVANLTPVKPYEGKFPSHNYKPGDEFDIRFMIAPRAIDAIKALNPRACLIGYKLFDAETDEELISIARHTLADAKANIIFANTPASAKSRKLAVLADNSVIPCNFNDHLRLMKQAIDQEYFHTKIVPLTQDEQADPDIQEALAAVKAFEPTFGESNGHRYGTVAIPVARHPRMFATTSRGHFGEPVIVRSVDMDELTVTASGKATLNAPALAAMLGEDKNCIVVHRHFDDPLAAETTLNDAVADIGTQFPGTKQEAETVESLRVFEVIEERHHGYLRRLPVRGADWTKYHETFPEKYFGVPDAFRAVIHEANNRGLNTLEIGGNVNAAAMYAYDPYVMAKTAQNITLAEISRMRFDLGFARNALNYLSMDVLKTILARCSQFVANTFAAPPQAPKIANREASVYDRKAGAIRHTLILKDDSIMRHWFHAYTAQDLKGLGLHLYPYGKNSMLVTKEPMEQFKSLARPAGEEET